MIPKLYDKTGNVNIGNLNDLIECKVTEERNGLFDLALVYPAGYIYADNLIKENIIVARANDTLLNQKFRIYSTKKMTKNRIKVLARHVSFDIAYDFIKSINITNQSCEYALNTIFRSSQFSKQYIGHSDIVNAQDFKVSGVNCLRAISGAEGSIIDTFGTGAEILRDNIDIYVLNSRGRDNGVTIEYKKNLTGFELEEDTTDLETRVGGFSKYKNETDEEIIIESDWIDSPFVDNYSHPYIRLEGSRDYSDRFKDGEIPTKEKLNNLCRQEFTINKKDIIKQRFKLEFVPLSKCVGYEGLEDKISLCDKVTIKHSLYGIDTQAKVIKTVYNVLTERYDSMELGEPKTSLGDIISEPVQGKDGKDSVNYEVEILSSNGNVFKNGNISTIFTCNVYKNNIDITKTIPDQNFHWEKINNDGTIDKVWGDKYLGGTKSVIITKEDVFVRATFNCKVDGIIKNEI